MSLHLSNYHIVGITCHGSYVHVGPVSLCLGHWPELPAKNLLLKLRVRQF